MENFDFGVEVLKISTLVPELELYHIVTVNMMLMRIVVEAHYQKTRKTSIELQGAAFDDHLDPLHGGHLY